MTLGGKIFRNVTQKRAVRLILPYAILVVFLLAYFIYQHYRPGKADSTTVINNVATVQFCTQGDGCDPAKNYTGFAASNTVTIGLQTVTGTVSPTASTQTGQPSASPSAPSPTPTPSATGATSTSTVTKATTLPLKISLEGRAKDKYKTEEVKITVTDAQTGQAIANKNDATISDSGEVAIDGNFSADKTYKITIKVPGFIQIETASKNNQIATPTSALVVGDFDGDNKITVADIVSVIAAHNGANRPEVIKAFDKVPDLPEIVQVIRNSNASH